MKRKGPIITLTAGAVLAAALMVINLNVNAPPAGGLDTAAAGGATPAGPTTPAPTTTPPAAPAGAQVTFAGGVGGGATLSIAVADDQAVAYLCDGKRVEAWLSGTARNGELILTGSGGASLTGAFVNGRAKGEVDAAGRSFDFDLATVAPPSGLYRATAQVRGAKVVGGWIVLADGTQVGVLTINGTPQPAPPLDPSAGTAEVDGVAITAVGVDGTGLN